ncbi:MAG: CvpA family protein [Ruminococcaceae bacterium]|nr:CvpA family protein [Oscillospiraceae bacterium]
MTLTVFSFAFLTVFVTCMLLCIFKGIKAGFVKTAISLASMVASFFISTLIAQKMSNIFADDIAQAVYGTNVLSDMGVNSEQVNQLILAYADALITPFLFLPLFFVVYRIIDFIVNIVYRTSLKPSSEDTEYELEGKNSSAYNHNSKLLGGIIGGVCGILTAVIITFPIMGTLDFAYIGSSFLDPESGSMYIYTPVKDDDIDKVCAYSKDVVGNVIYSMGGKPMYNFVARSKLNGVNIGIMSEIEKTTETAGHVTSLINEISKGKSRPEDQYEKVETVREEINESETLKIIICEFMSIASERWIENEPFMGMERPIKNETTDPFMDEIFLLLRTSTTETAADDMATVLHVCLILIDSDISSVNGDYASMLGAIDKNNMLYDLRIELEKNSRTKYLSDTISEIVLRTTSSAMKANVVGNYDALISNLTTELNRVKLQEYDVQGAHIAETFKSEMEAFGVPVPESVASIVADELTRRHCRYLRETTKDDVRKFFDGYTGIPEN